MEFPTIYATTQALLNNALADIVSQLGHSVVAEIGEKIAFDNTHRVQHYIANRTGDLIRRINDTSKRAIRNQLKEAMLNNESVEDIGNRIENVFDQADGVRSLVIAQTESTKAAGFAANEAMVQARIERKTWLTTRDGKARDSHVALDGQTVDINGVFRTPDGAEAEYPGGFGIAEEDINCRCAVIADFSGGKAKHEEEVMKAMWQSREQKRAKAEARILTTARRVFLIQRTAVLQRLAAVTG